MRNGKHYRLTAAAFFFLAAAFLAGCGDMYRATVTKTLFKGDLPPGDYATLRAVNDFANTLQGIHSSFSGYENLDSESRDRFSDLAAYEYLKLLPGSYVIRGKCSTQSDRTTDPFVTRKKNQVEFAIDVEAGFIYYVQCEYGDEAEYEMVLFHEEPVAGTDQ
jgi:hypothetical protein